MCSNKRKIATPQSTKSRVRFIVCFRFEFVFRRFLCVYIKILLRVKIALSSAIVNDKDQIISQQSGSSSSSSSDSDSDCENITRSTIRSSCSSTMPSKQANSDVLAMEELVHEIKENLRLKANPTRAANRSTRPSPYHIPCRSWSGETTSATTCDHHHTTTKSASKTNLSHHHHHHSLHSKKDDSIDDPYELLQALLKSNNLVKEAVRRLQLNNISPKQRYFYESDEESRSPMIRMCQLEL